MACLKVNDEFQEIKIFVFIFPYLGNMTRVNTKCLPALGISRYYPIPIFGHRTCGKMSSYYYREHDVLNSMEFITQDRMLLFLSHPFYSS